MQNDLSSKIIGCAIAVHKELGPGLLESVYETCLAHDFETQGISFERQKPIPVIYKGTQLEVGYRMDFLVENSILLELKAVDFLAPIHEAQILSYLKMSKMKTGLLINFNVTLLKNGIRRIVN